MFKLEEMPFWFWLTFVMVYSCIGDSDDNTWGGIFFLTNYTILFWAFLFKKSERIKISGLCMSGSLFLFSAIKFFICPEIERYCIFILFLMSISLNIYLQIKRK